MSNPIASFSGLASGVQWRDIVDQLLEVERSRTVAPIERQIEARNKQKEAWNNFKGLVEKLNSTMIVYGDDPCPPSTNDTIVVCARKPDNITHTF